MCYQIAPFKKMESSSVINMLLHKDELCMSISGMYKDVSSSRAVVRGKIQANVVLGIYLVFAYKAMNIIS